MGDEDDNDNEGDIRVLYRVKELAKHSALTGRSYYTVEQVDESRFTRAMQAFKAMHALFRISSRKRKVDNNGDSSINREMQLNKQQRTAARVIAVGENNVGMLVGRGGDGASLRRHQYKVLLRIINPAVSNIIYVALTKLSKSISFILPVLLSEGSIFVLVKPTRALQDNITGRLKAASISTYA